LDHHRKLETMYAHAPVNRFYRPTLTVSEARAEVRIEVGEHLFHSAGAMHGSVYFKMLDDAAWFAANSLVFDVFVLTATFEVKLRRPVSTGRIRAVGTVQNDDGRSILAEAILYDYQNRVLATGHGRFARGPTPLQSVASYRLVQSGTNQESDSDPNR